MSKFQHLQSNQEKKVINFKAYIASSILNRVKFVLKSPFFQGTWVAQLVMRPTLDFGSGHDLTVHGIEPCIGLHANSLLRILSLLLSLPLPLSRAIALSLKKNKQKNFWFKYNIATEKYTKQSIQLNELSRSKHTHVTTFRPWNRVLISQRLLEPLYPQPHQGHHPPNLHFVWWLGL